MSNHETSAWRSHLANSGIALAYFYLTGVVVLLGACLGLSLIDAQTGRHRPQSLLDVASGGVGHRYADIVAFGYQGVVNDESCRAFFPLFPLLGRAVVEVIGAGPIASLWFVSSTSLAGLFVALRIYAKERFGELAEQQRDYVLLALGLWPATFFFRMAYPEPLFMLLSVLALLSIARRSPVWVSGLIAGLASAARPVGIALAPAVALRAWSVGGSPLRRCIRAASSSILACWGLLAFMAYQHATCGDALAFAHAQSHFRVRPEAPAVDRAAALAWLEPVIDLYRPSSEIYWRDREKHGAAALSLLAANPALFAVVVAAVLFGAWKGWLTRYELALSVGLLAIPYVTRAYEMGMSGMGRFAAAVFPFYLVAGRLLCLMPRFAAAVLLGIGAIFLIFYSCLFAAGFPLN